jgi:O-Antigen ligase
MLNLSLILVTIVLSIIIPTIFFGGKISYKTLQNIAKYIVWSLPFELIPSLQISGVSVRISQLLVILGFYVITILLFKKDSKLLNHKLNPYSILPVLFLFFDLTSWLNILDSKRFLTYHIATILVFGAWFLVANFLQKPFERLRELTLILSICAVFGWYQLIGDYAGLPTALTGLREQYTKAVFGIARIQGTAIEPLHFAGMLSIGLIFMIYLTVRRQNIFGFANQNLPETIKKTVILSEGGSGFGSPEQASPRQAKDPLIFNLDNKYTVQKTSEESSKTNNGLPHFVRNDRFFTNVFYKLTNPINLVPNIILIILFIATIIFTFSKGTWAILTILFVLSIIWGICKAWRSNVSKVKLNYKTLILAFGGIVLTVIGVINLSSQGPFANITNNVIETLQGTSPSSVERRRFQEEATKNLPNHIILGIGAGQFGPLVNSDLGNINQDDSAIVNNAYLEIWLENGLLAFLVFLFWIVVPVVRLLGRFRLKEFSLTLILLGFYGQWALISPIFIMPAFVVMGIAYNFLEQNEV